MSRLFVAVALPPVVAERVALLAGGIPRARWEAADKLHVTLRFLGPVDGAKLRAVESALATVHADPFSMTLEGVGFFPPRGKPKTLWVGIRDPEPLAALERKIDRALGEAGIGDRRKFAPHVTIGRLKNAPIARVAAFMSHNALFRTEPFPVDRFGLFSSVLSPGGSKYRLEAVYVLGHGILPA